jgi:hypothetical protein
MVVFIHVNVDSCIQVGYILSVNIDSIVVGISVEVRLSDVSFERAWHLLWHLLLCSVVSHLKVQALLPRLFLPVYYAIPFNVSSLLTLCA